MATARRSRGSRLVVDVGNSRIKWGLCDDAAVSAVASLPPYDESAWREQIKKWRLKTPLSWWICGVHHERRDAFADWLRQRGDAVRLLSAPAELPLQIAVDHPTKVGIDRLLNAVAVNSRRSLNAAAVIVDAGSAVTVDYVDDSGIFRGGAILPGLNMMAEALHNYTALLPLIRVDDDFSLPATSTATAMKAGIMCAAIGGIKELIGSMAKQQASPKSLEIYLGGGDAQLLSRQLPAHAQLWPEMTLEGVRLATDRTESS
ncbi:MAG TPA: type III pantothenate kinase [Gemmataceae bacterium]|nr:type III pantothenate kinase [Gemmataceae bacterium]